MKIKQYILEPETVAEKDGISALKSAMNEYCHGYYTKIFAFGGDMMATASKSILNYILEILKVVEVDEFGRDANGLDIKSAVLVLGHVKPA